MMYMPDALRAAVKIMEADPWKLIHRNAFNVASMSFDPEILAAKIREHIPTFTMRYQVDPVRQAIADSWPDSMNDRAYAYVEDIPRHARFKRGEWVETNGYSSIFPAGVLVGQIVEVYNSRDGLSYKLKVRLSTDFGTLRDVVVISDKSIAERMRLMQAARDSLKLNVRE